MRPHLESRPHAVLIAWGFPPCRGSGVYRAIALANGLVQVGFRVTVVTCDESFWEDCTGKDASLMSRLDPAVSIVRVPFRWPEIDRNLRNWGFLRLLSPALWKLVRRRLVGVRAALSPVRKYESPYWSWRRPVLRQLHKLHTKDSVSIVIATANPYVSAIAAANFSAKTGVPYVVDNRDAMTLDVFSGEVLCADIDAVQHLERSLFSNALQVWFVNEPIADWYRARYPSLRDQVRVVTNGWDPQFIRSSSMPLGPETVFSYLGTIGARVPIREFLSGWEHFLAGLGLEGNLPKVRIYGHLGFFGSQSESIRSAIEQFASKRVEYMGPVPKTQVQRVYDEADAMLLVLGPGRFVTSGKVFEYMAAGKPIVAIHEPDSAASSVLHDYPYLFPATDMSPRAIAAALRNCWDVVQQGVDIRLTEIAAARFRRDIVMQPAIRSLRESVGD